MIDFLQNHTDESRPPACPPLDPIRPSDLLSLIDSPAGRYVAVLFESDGSYLGREVLSRRRPACWVPMFQSHWFWGRWPGLGIPRFTGGCGDRERLGAGRPRGSLRPRRQGLLGALF